MSVNYTTNTLLASCIYDPPNMAAVAVWSKIYEVLIVIVLQLLASIFAPQGARVAGAASLFVFELPRECRTGVAYSRIASISAPWTGLTRPISAFGKRVVCLVCVLVALAVLCLRACTQQHRAHEATCPPHARGVVNTAREACVGCVVLLPCNTLGFYLAVVSFLRMRFSV